MCEYFIKRERRIACEKKGKGMKRKKSFIIKYEIYSWKIACVIERYGKYIKCMRNLKSS